MGHKLFSGALALVLVITCFTALALFAWWLPVVFAFVLAFFLWHQSAYVAQGTVYVDPVWSEHAHVAAWGASWTHQALPHDTKESQ